jgi:hypothetical protein
MAELVSRATQWLRPQDLLGICGIFQVRVKMLLVESTPSMCNQVPRKGSEWRREFGFAWHLGRSSKARNLLPTMDHNCESPQGTSLL